ncbi:Anthranilate 1,2-dioxygenase ferredoxin subunit [Delftia tsuruhatensis]|uniref:non-heme iron oxygenase ferredoxin subunit n=1 Tax=Delftia tsuruhatensis TaxID=180282 RepID=UPI001E6AA609|nr:non-heme iron oxygenase ferredoxin subunit [Delftia tsuruhatensis]CAB5713165.1 Anthranilate 1,2-dioxygenase ferredoxin subunit [Delftia tsuruhatensis]CAC9691936.1 Anthranilate 1,2-dioxygenase ferredoxin subunit [Delftia tsuruhatensis]
MTWTKIATTDQLGEDEALAIRVGELHLALFQSAGAFHVTDNVCTHQYALLSEGYVEDGCVECPLHQARFDLRSGQALCAPASQPIRVYPVRVEGADVLVDA